MKREKPGLVGGRGVPANFSLIMEDRQKTQEKHSLCHNVEKVTRSLEPMRVERKKGHQKKGGKRRNHLRQGRDPLWKHSS